MPLPLPADMLLPGAGALAVLVLLWAGLVVLVRRRRAARAAASAVPDAVEAVAMEPQRTTVAHAVAVREADTAPLPVSSADLLPSDLAAVLAAPVVLAGEPGVPSEPEYASEPVLAGVLAAGSVAVGERRRVVRGVDSSCSGSVDSTPEDTSGSGKPVAEALAQALAVRAASLRTVPEPDTPDSGDLAADSQPNGADADGPTATDSPGSDSAGPDSLGATAGHDPEPATDVLEVRPRVIGPAPRGDARDRLLAVLLADPVRTLRATVDLEACTTQLARLTAAVDRERAVLGEVLSRLAVGGLDTGQIAALAGLPVAEVERLLGAR